MSSSSASLGGFWELRCVDLGCPVTRQAFRFRYPEPPAEQPYRAPPAIQG